MRIITQTLLTGACIATALCAAEAKPAKPVVSFGDGWSLTIDGQYRTRSFWDTGLDFVDDDPRHNINHRARLGTRVEGPKGLTLRMVLQDVRLWGEETNTLNDFTANGFDVYEAWVQNALGADAWLRVGRQAISLDDQRIIGAVGWVQRARSFDGLRLQAKFGAVTAQAFGFRLVESHARGGDGIILDPSVEESDLVGAHVHAKIDDALKVSALVSSVLLKDNTRTTAGVYATGKAAGAAYNGAFYYQASETNGESGSSMLMAVEASYTLDVKLKPALVGRFERLTGDGTPEGTFATPFATNHKFYGEMDFFLNTVAQTFNLGLQDVGGGLRLTPAPWMKVFIDVHAFSSVEPGADDASSFGIETDARLWFRLNDHQTLVTVYGLFQPGDLFEAAKGSEAEHFGYLTFDSRF
jgi:hypothetical protein